MSKSHQTLPPDIYARWKYTRDQVGRAVLPRVVARKPAPGDFHPLSKRVIERYIRLVPMAYTYGLKDIELRPRQGQVGRPFGCYRPGEQGIQLYSVPSGPWYFPVELAEAAAFAENNGAVATEVEGGVQLEWPDPTDIELFYVSVLYHEMAHHYVHQYRNSRKLPQDVATNERLADLHVRKMQKHTVKLWQAIMREIGEEPGS